MSKTNQLVVFDPSSLDDLKQLSDSAFRVLFLISLTFGNYVSMTQGQVGNALGIHRTAISRAFGELDDRGLIKKVGQALYKVCPVVSLIHRPSGRAEFALIRDWGT